MGRTQQTCLILSRKMLAELLAQLVFVGEQASDDDYIMATFIQSKLSYESLPNSGLYQKIITALASCSVVPTEHVKLNDHSQNITFPSVTEVENAVKSCQQSGTEYFRKYVRNYIEIHVPGEVD